MNEGNRGAARAGAWRLVDGGGPGGDHGLEGGGTVVDPVADVVQALTPPLEMPGDRRVGPGGSRELDVALADPDQRFLDPIGVDDLAVMHLGTERGGVVGDGVLEVVDGDRDMVDGGQLHCAETTRVSDSCHHQHETRCDTRSMAFTPDDLESVDVSDADAVKDALTAAAARIRELEHEGIRAVGGAVAEILDHAVTSGDKLLAEAKADAAATREAAEKAVAELSEAGEAAAKQIREAEQTAAATIAEATAAADGIAARAETEAIERSARVISDAQQRLDRLLAAERDVHDRLQAAMADIQTSVSRVGVSQKAELALTVEDPATEPVADDPRWADDPPDEVTARRRSA